MKKIILFSIFLIFSNMAYANERFIPLELFTGGEIREDTEIRFTPADKKFGKKGRKYIEGPKDWRAPGSKDLIKVYKRTLKNKEGRVKKHNYLLLQMMVSAWVEFTIKEGQGLNI